MRVPFSSNIVACLYTCLELILAIIAPLVLSKLAGILNVKRIYTDRQKVNLTTGKLQFLSNHGLAEPSFHLFVASFLLINTLLLTVGSFAIVGVTNRQEDVPVKYLVKRAAADHLLNINEHIDYKTGKVSGELLLLRSVKCTRRHIDDEVLYESFYDEEIRDGFNFDPEERFNVTCLRDSSGFLSKPALKYNFWKPDKKPDDDCFLHLWEKQEQVKNLTFLHVIKEMRENCDEFKVRDAWCFRYKKRIGCAAHMLLSQSEEYRLVVWFLNRSKVQPRISQIFGTNSSLTTSFATEVVKNAAVLTAMNVIRASTSADKMMLLQVHKQVMVKRNTSGREETEVSNTLICFTLLPVIIMLSIAVVVTSIHWMRVVYFPKRQTYNRFNSVSDLLSCAVIEKFNTGGCRYRRNDDLTVHIAGGTGSREARIETR